MVLQLKVMQEKSWSELDIEDALKQGTTVPESIDELGDSVTSKPAKPGTGSLHHK